MVKQEQLKDDCTEKIFNLHKNMSKNKKQPHVAFYFFFSPKKFKKVLDY